MEIGWKCPEDVALRELIRKWRFVGKSLPVCIESKTARRLPRSPLSSRASFMITKGPRASRRLLGSMMNHSTCSRAGSLFKNQDLQKGRLERLIAVTKVSRDSGKKVQRIPVSAGEVIRRAQPLLPVKQSSDRVSHHRLSRTGDPSEANTRGIFGRIVQNVTKLLDERLPHPR